ncbi:MAG: hypothetical protein IPM42_03035 [Saprospiraceae bacterium]|nr:hypothetical protein [Saprospiraceae bacterium]
MRRRGKTKALVAVGHEIIIAVYHILSKEGEVYRVPELRVSEDKNKQTNYHLTKLKELGFDIETISKAI